MALALKWLLLARRTPMKMAHMTQPNHHLAQLNIARMLAPLTDPSMADFVANLDPINQLAEDSPGFVWRLKGSGNDATSLRPFDDDFLIINLSVWTSLEALQGYVYHSDHTAFLRRRKEWFSKMADAMVVLWWVPLNHQPSLEEAKQRLLHLREHGETAQAFSFKKPMMPAAR